MCPKNLNVFGKLFSSECQFRDSECTSVYLLLKEYLWQRSLLEFNFLKNPILYDFSKPCEVKIGFFRNNFVLANIIKKILF